MELSELIERLNSISDDLEEVGEIFTNVEKKIKASCGNRRRATKARQQATNFKPIHYNHTISPAQPISSEVFANAYYTTE